MVKKYMLITAARNEEAYIANTIKSVIGQTILPTIWVIVSDGSTDKTNQIIEQYSQSYNFIRLIKITHHTQRSFGSKVNALKEGLANINIINYEFIGNLDADVSLEKDYYEKIFQIFEKRPKLGIAGGIILDLIDKKYVPQNISLNSVAGAIQMFRYKCFKDIGGYIPFKYGGEDAYMEIKARMNGWTVETFPKLKIYHHKRVGTGSGNILKAKFLQGRMFHTLGYFSFFLIVRSFYRVFEKPYFIGSVFQIFGYFWSLLKNEKRPVPDNFIYFVRTEQKKRLKSLFGFNTRGRFIKTSRMMNFHKYN